MVGEVGSAVALGVSVWWNGLGIWGLTGILVIVMVVMGCWGRFAES